MMNPRISSRGDVDIVYRRVCALLMLGVLLGFSLAIGGSVLDLVMLRNLGLGLFLMAASSLLAVMVLAHGSEDRP
jgi:high-affinity Fe2+/Pb2+ permease